MYTILGAKGVIARELSRALVSFSPVIRQVSRNPRKVNPTDETFIADLLDARATVNAISGSEAVYLVTGLKYVTFVWQEQWPQVMRKLLMPAYIMAPVWCSSTTYMPMGAWMG